jgi:hypothetical protein
MEERTWYPFPRIFCIVLALAGDSTTTSDLAILPPERELRAMP